MFFSSRSNAEIGTIACIDVRRAILVCEELVGTWKSASEHGTTSTVECIQICSDISQTSMLTGSFKFYFLHIKFLNVGEMQRRRETMSGTQPTKLLVRIISNCSNR